MDRPKMNTLSKASSIKHQASSYKPQAGGGGRARSEPQAAQPVVELWRKFFI